MMNGMDEEESGYYRVLTMVYNSQRYWAFGLCPKAQYLWKKVVVACVKVLPHYLPG
jgi:hypothetical protein